MRRVPKIVHVFKFILLGFIFCCAIGFAVQYLWNWLIPELFKGPVITFWQALGLFTLGKLVLGWHGGGGPWNERARERWRMKMKERMEHMTDEQREQIRDRFRKCGMGPWNRRGEDIPRNEDNAQSKTETNI